MPACMQAGGGKHFKLHRSFFSQQLLCGLACLVREPLVSPEYITTDYNNKACTGSRYNIAWKKRKGEGVHQTGRQYLSSKGGR